jgi:hypothetical protein
MLFNPAARFDLAARLHAGEQVPLAEVFTFLSGLYFRGKRAYAAAFGRSPLPDTLPAAWVITTNRGLVPAESPVTLDDVRGFASGDVHPANAAYHLPLETSARALAAQLPDHGEVVLLGSIATGKYVDVLLKVFGDRLMFPEQFVGRGDMSRGGLMLRCVDEGRELTYVRVEGAVRRGTRPPKLPKRQVPKHR